MGLPAPSYRGFGLRWGFWQDCGALASHLLLSRSLSRPSWISAAEPPYTPSRAASLSCWATLGFGSAATLLESNEHLDSRPILLPAPTFFPCLLRAFFVFLSPNFLITHLDSAAASTDLTGFARCWRVIRRVSQLGVRSRPLPAGAADPDWPWALQDWKTAPGPRCHLTAAARSLLSYF